MGTDIKLYLEYKDFEWMPFGLEYWVSRNYRLFSLMAVVRSNDIYPVLFQPKGIPQDLWEYVQSQYEKDSFHKDLFHDSSWLSFEEYKHCIDKYSLDAKGEIFQYIAILKSMEVLESYGYETRLIFWFEL